MKYKKVILIVMTAFLFTSCNNGNEDLTTEVETPATAEVETQAVPQSGKTISISMRTPKTLNPLTNEDKTVDEVLKLIFEPIVNIDENQKPISNIAESLSFSEDGRNLVLTLKNNLFWHDGTPVTASDISYSIDVLKNAPDTSIYKHCIRNINIYELSEDNNSITITYNQAFIGNAYNLEFPIIPRHFFTDNLNSLEPIGNGAYKFDSFANSKELNLTKNENYFKEKPLIDFIKVVISPNVEADMTAFEQNVTNVISSGITELGKYRGSKDTNTKEFITNNFDFIGFNFEKPVFKDSDLRKIIAQVIDKDEIVSSIYLGHAIATDSPVNPQSWLYELETTKYFYDLESSKLMLEDIGYNLNENSELVKKIDGADVKLDFKILVNEENQERVKIAEYLNKNLKEIGINSTIEIVTFDEYVNKINSKDFDLVVGGYYMSVIPDFTFMLHSSKIETGENIFAYNNPVMDEKLAEVFSASNDIEAKSLLSDLQLFIGDELPCISLVYRESALLTDKNIYGNFNPTAINIYNNINEWFVFDEEKPVEETSPETT